MRLVIPIIGLLLALHSEAQTKTPVKTSKPVSATTAGSNGYNIPITLTPLKNTYVYLGSYFGKYKNMADSAWLNDKGQGVFKGNKKFPKGIYFVVSPNKYLLFEVLMDDKQNFSIKADTAALQNATVTGSEDNTLFQDYTRFLAQKAPKLNQLQQQLAAATTASDSATIREALVRGNKELQDYRENIMEQQPNSMLASFFYTMKRPEVPAIPVAANGKADSSYPYRFVKANWWEGVDFSNEALVRTPFFEPKLEEYYKYYVHPEADSIIPEVNYMLLVSRENREMFKYLLGKFTDKYINPEYMGQEKVFLFLFDKYFSKGDTTWLSQSQRKYIFDRAYSLMANQLGEVAAELNMLDTAGKNVSLYNIKAPYTFITFWDPHCGHCKETVPRVDSIYRAKWKALGVKIVGVNVDEGANDSWKKFIKDHKLNDWAHIYQPKSVKEDEAKRGVANFRQLYDVYKTPTLYLLDSEKRIIGKMLSIEQFDEVLQAKLKNPAPKK
ncbi:TlpA family protein disulfide reductase [Aridibaculum aurantiacum]|uniref:TlpA family protein disulfide reductase n=1 Tax=Aridibaculum aurantiacum TaxID=2810307 RepID=UPI001A977285|nr:TlpA family protein disulfide reductase [Aridibaculum aurantiacum]